MQVIALLSTKGGAGKTALATALAVEMGREGKHLDAGAPEDIEYLRAHGATKPTESAAVWTFPDGSKLQARRGRLYL